jgi:hypothetical protein
MGIAAIVIWFASSGPKPAVAKVNAPQTNNAASANQGATPNTPLTALAPTPAAVTSPLPETAPVTTGQGADFADEKMGFRVTFPAPPTDYEPASVSKDDNIAAQFQRDMLKSMKEKGQLQMVQATSGKRTYLASAMALPLVGVTANQYFDRLESNIGALHPGFELDGKSTRGNFDGHPYCDLKLKDGTTQKVLRMMPANGFVYGLIVEGPGVTPADGDVSRFFASLKLSKPQQPERSSPNVAEAKGAEPNIAANTPAADPPTTTPEPPATDPAPAPKTRTEPAAPPEPEVPLGPPFPGKKTQFTVRFPEGAATKAVDTLKAFADAKKRNETKNRWNDDKALYESFSAEKGGRTYLVTAWRDRELTGNDANNAQLRRMRDLLHDQLDRTRPTIVNSELAKKVDGRSLYTRRYRRDGKLIVYQEIRAGAFCCVLQVQCPSEVDERTDRLIWAFFNSLEVTP